MPLLNKDGKPYKLFSEPNPLVKDQVILPKKQLEFHNFKWKPVLFDVEEFNNISVEEIQEINAEIEEQFEEIIPKAKIEEVKVENKNISKVQIEEKIVVEQHFEERIELTSELNDNDIPKDQIVLIHCHPAINSNENILYGKKHMFEGFIVDSNDIEICIYTKQQNLTLKSIIFPSKYKNGQKLEMLRWWKIKNIKQQDDEYLIYGEITNEQRSF